MNNSDHQERDDGQIDGVKAITSRPRVTTETNNLIQRALTTCRLDEQGWTLFTTLGSAIRFIAPSFDPYHLGFRNLSDLLAACDSIEIRRDDTDRRFARSRTGMDGAPETTNSTDANASRQVLVRKSSDGNPSRPPEVPQMHALNTANEELQHGTISRLNERDFGFIKNSTTGEEAFFHISKITHPNLGLPIPGDSVSYKTQKGEKGLVASHVMISWHYGIVAKFITDRGFGFIQCAEMKDDLFFFRDALGDTTRFIDDPFAGNYVVFSQIAESPRGLKAANVNRISPAFGVVEAWNRKTGVGTIRLESSSLSVPVRRRDVFSKEGNLEEGWSVSLIVSGDTARRYAVCVQKELPLRRFAHIDDEARMLEDLAAKVLPGENWEYRDSSHHSRFPILESYLFYTFQRLEEEDAGKPAEQRKIKIARTKEGHEKAAFNTGLVDHTYRPVYAGFTKNIVCHPGDPLWTFECFVARGEIIRGRSYMSIFPDLPERAEYFTDPRDVVYDTSLRLDAVTDHIVGERCQRLPKKLQERVPLDMKDPGEIQSYLADYLKMAIERALERIKWNYKTAVPQYFFSQHRMQLLLPLCIEDPRRVDLAIAVEREGGAYVGRTILELDWAYNNARLIARPDSDWLTPNVIQDRDEQPDSEPSTKRA
jgi:cold shock CspA family protein